MINHDPILSLAESADYLHISQVTLWRLHAKERTLVKPIQISPGRKGYRRSTLDRYLDRDCA
ncbi:helix-turn-helix transcriptional regulator [Halomonas sp. IOP_31]|uniref:helix-turn-helix transcriptional regulator n=1 Tax=Halomonas sp. IOP_31 TaxID=2876584 RepID=UPI001E63F386|nr:hypothetical protein [Halomonas sp. IOP_31]MCD6006855.1 hypothetical protein [Halomonas sp. IOP_31]